MLLGRARSLHAVRGSSESILPSSDITRATALVFESLDRETFEQLIRRGRELTEAEAEDLLLAAKDA